MIQSFIKEMLARIKAVNLKKDGALAPKSEVEPGERVVGILSDDLKKFHVVLRSYTENTHNECLRAHSRMSKPTPEDMTLAQRHILAHGRLDILRDVFWQGVKEQFPVLVKERKIGLRKDWKVVICPRENEMDQAHRLTEDLGAIMTLIARMEA